MRNTIRNAQNQMSQLLKRERDLFNSPHSKLVDIHREMEAAHLAIIRSLARTDTVDSIFVGSGRQLTSIFEPKWGQELKISQGFFTSVDVDVDNGGGKATLTYQGETARVGESLTQDVDHWDVQGTRVLISNSSDSGHNGEYGIDATLTVGNVIGLSSTMEGIDTIGNVVLIATILADNLG